MHTAHGSQFHVNPPSDQSPVKTGQIKPLRFAQHSTILLDADVPSPKYQIWIYQDRKCQYCVYTNGKYQSTLETINIVLKCVNKIDTDKVVSYCETLRYMQIHVYKQFKTMKELFFIMSNSQTHFHFKLYFLIMKQYTGRKWLIHGTKHHKDNQLQELELSCRISQ